MKISLERRRTVKPWHLIGVPLLSVIFGTIVGGLFLEATGHNAILVFKTMSETSYTTLYGIGDTLAAATPLIFTALAALVAFRVNLYSIGAEGQLFVGGIFASGVGIAVGNSALAIPAVLIAGIVGGVVWMTLPALFRAWFGTSEIITTLMFNFVALFLMRYLIYGASTYWRDPTSTNFPQGKKLDQNAWNLVLTSKDALWISDEGARRCSECSALLRRSGEAHDLRCADHLRWFGRFSWRQRSGWTCACP
ncbi:MAG: ABC transporter permease [Actinobacteria bacterium]|nr:ABC transporter permease [Actinomycetota bacterium]